MDRLEERSIRSDSWRVTNGRGLHRGPAEEELMLHVGEAAPPIEAIAADGRPVSLQGLQGRRVIVYFFHKAFTPNCTVETRGFRDNYEDLRQIGFEVIGISTDSALTQCRFAEKLGVSYPMIGDAGLALARSYRVLWPLIPFTRRVAYVLGVDHRVLAAFRHEFQVSRHLDEVLTYARGVGARSGPAPRTPRS